MNTDMAPARPALRDVGALLRHADQRAHAAIALPAMVRHRLVPDEGHLLREDDISLSGGFVEAVGRQLAEALLPDEDETAGTTIGHKVVLVNGPATRFIFARAIEARLCRNAQLIGLAMPELPPRVEAQTADSQDEVAETAMALIVAQSRFIGNARGFHLDLNEFPPELLSILVRQVLVWGQEQTQANPLALRAAADGLLAAFDERSGRPHRLMRFCHVLELPRAADAWLLADNGPSLVFAMLARASGLPAEHLIDMVQEPGLARLTIVLRACDVDAYAATRLTEGLAMLASLRPDEIASVSTYSAIPQHDAAAMVAGWRNRLGPEQFGSVW